MNPKDRRSGEQTVSGAGTAFESICSRAPLSSPSLLNEWSPADLHFSLLHTPHTYCEGIRVSSLDSPHIQPCSQSSWMGTESTDRDSRREGVQQIRETSLGDDAAGICRLRGKDKEW